MKQKVFVVAAVGALLAAGSLAAVSATGQSTRSKPPGARKAARMHRARDLAMAASYLGISSAQLTSELSSGKSLAQVAQATPGKSADGLIQSLLAAKKAKVDALAAGLPRRVSSEVNRPGGPGRGALASGGRAGHGIRRIAALFAKPIRPGSVAAGYLGLSPAQLQSELLAGKTLGQIADGTAGHSQAGLVGALVAAGRQRLDQGVSAGKLTAAHESKRLGHVEKRANAVVKRKFAGRSSH